MLPLLAEVVARKREVAAALADRLSLAPYDALLDGFEPGARRQTSIRLFAELRAFLPGFIARALERQTASRRWRRRARSRSSGSAGWAWR